MGVWCLLTGDPGQIIDQTEGAVARGHYDICQGANPR
jgi:hypothetical protein